MGVFMYSSDGVSWTIYRTEVGGTRREWLDVNYCNGTFVAVGYRETITTSTEKTEAWTAYSENPSKWTGVQVTSKGMDKLLCITNDGIRYIALGILYSDVDSRVVLSSTDGSTWTKLGVSEVSDVESRVCFGSISSGVYAGVYGFNKYSLSDDAVAWNLNGIAGLPSGKFPYLNGICFGDGRLVAVGNVIAVSESGRADLSYLGEVDQSVLNDVCHKGV